MSERPSDLTQVRARVDAIDDELLRLVDARAALAADGEADETTRAGGFSPPCGLRPAQEAQTLRRLLAPPRVGASARLVVRLWRELAADDLARRGAWSVSLYGGAANPRVLEGARARFGAALPVTPHGSAQSALTAARTGGVIAVIALEHRAPWWMRLLAEPDLAVFDALPAFAADGPPFALAVARLTLEPSGADRTFYVVDTDLQAGQVESRLQDEGLVGDLVQEVGSMKLFALAGFVERSDRRLLGVPGGLKGVIGAAPLPFDL